MKWIIRALVILMIAAPLLIADDDLETSLQALKEAAAKKDAVLVKKLAAETCVLARKVLAEPAPAAEEEKPLWKTRVDVARSIELQTEYALYTTAIQSPPETTVDLLAALGEQNPKSQYLDDAYGPYFVALKQTGASAKVQGVAEHAVANFPENEDVLLVLTESALNRKQTDTALRYAERLQVVMAKHPKPANMPAPQWERKRVACLGRAYWIAGIMHSEKTHYKDADKDLRAALPLIKDNPAMLGAALFHLGLANYQLGRLLMSRAQVMEGAKFSEEAAAIPGPFSQQAWRNAAIMKREAARFR